MDPSPYVVTETLRLRNIITTTSATLIGFLWYLLFVGFVEIEWSANGISGYEINVAAISFDPFVLLVVGVLSYALLQRAKPNTVLAIQPTGVTIRSVSVPWSSIDEVVLIRPAPSAYDPAEPEVGLRLLSEAPLPAALTSLVIDPSTPADIPSGLRTTLDGKSLDTERLVEAVRSCAPGGVSVVERHGTTERTPETVSH